MLFRNKFQQLSLSIQIPRPFPTISEIRDEWQENIVIIIITFSQLASIPPGLLKAFNRSKFHVGNESIDNPYPKWNFSQNGRT